MNRSVYLDYNATAPIRAEVIELVTDVMREGGNPSSVHASGRRARGRVETARKQIADLVSCKPQEIIFTSGGTESNNLALKAFADHALIVGGAEHDSVLAASAGRDAILLQCDETGMIDRTDLEVKLSDAPSPSLVSVMLANNETGVIQSISEIAELVHQYNGILHTDAIQACGKIPVDFRELGVDMMSLSAHKIGGPQGEGALVVREGIAIQSIQKGGGQELGRRGGTENVAGIAGFGLAAQLAVNAMPIFDEIEQLRDQMEATVLKISPSSVIYGKETTRLPNTSCLSMPGVGSELQVMNFDLAGIAISAGSACSSGKVKASHVLLAMGAGIEDAAQAIRISLGWQTTQSDMDKFIEVWEKLYQRKSPKFAA